MKTQSFVLVVGALLVGCGAGATVAVSWAGPNPGQWTCYETDEIPDVDRGKDPNNLHEAQTSGYATSMSNLLNQTASSAPVGATEFIGGVGPAGMYGYFCAKN